MKAKKLSAEAQLAALRASPTEDAARTALASAPWLLVSAAAKLAGDETWYALADALVAAYARMAEPKADPTFAARTAILAALTALSRWDDAIGRDALATFGAATDLPMLERVVPASDRRAEDTAARVRAGALFAAVSAGCDDALDIAAELLGDPAPSVRRSAAEALGASGQSGAAALARYKLEHIGDIDDDVLQALASTILELEPERGPAFLVRLLDEGDRRAEIVALALGAARATECVDALVRWSNACSPADRERVGFLPLALLRDDGANAWLAERIAGTSARDAVAAATALATFAVDANVAALIRGAAGEQKDRAARAAILALLDG